MYDKEVNVEHEGFWLTMTTKGAMTISVILKHSINLGKNTKLSCLIEERLQSWICGCSGSSS